jgi:hypothetical protein
MSDWKKLASVQPPHAVIFREQTGEDGNNVLAGSIQVLNESTQSIMFKVKTTSQDSYYVRPNLGIVEPK